MAETGLSPGDSGKEIAERRHLAGSETGMALAAKRFRPEFAAAFAAWQATNPDTNPDAPPGPTYMVEYKQPERDQADELNTQGAKDGTTSDNYVRTTVFLASVLFLVGISGHFNVRAARYGLVAVGAGLLALSVVLLLLAPKPPGL
jgi:hypothetical protein